MPHSTRYAAPRAASSWRKRRWCCCPPTHTDIKSSPPMDGALPTADLASPYDPAGAPFARAGARASAAIVRSIGAGSGVQGAHGGRIRHELLRAAGAVHELARRGRQRHHRRGHRGLLRPTLSFPRLYLGRLKGGPAALPPPLLPLRPVLATAPKRSRCARRPACRCVAIHRAHFSHAPCAHPSPSPAVPFHAFVMFFFF